MTLVYLSSAWVLGIYLGSKFTLPPFIICLGFLPLCLTLLLSQYKKLLLLIAFCLFAFFGGIIYLQSSLPVVDETHLQFYNDYGIVEIEGVICNDPETKDKVSTFQLSVSALEINGTKKQVSGKALILMSRYPEYHYGDVLKVIGKMETPQQFDDFDYKSYLANLGIYSVISYPTIKTLDTDRGSKPISWIYSLRNQLSQSLSLALPEPQASLAQGILLGLRGNIPYPLRDAFSRTGTAHLLAISGLHLSIIIGILLSAGIWLFGRRYYIYIWLALLAIWLYVLLTGMRPPIIRGAVMGSMFLIAEGLGRQRSAITALAFAAAIMVGVEPQILWRTSFQLSFLAISGLIILFPHFQSWGRRGVIAISNTEGMIASSYNFVVDSLAVTLAAILATWPVIAYNFGIVSFTGPPATFFALLALPGIIIATAIVSGVGLLAPFLAYILGWIAWLFLSYLILIVQVFDAIPLSFAELGSIQIWQIWCYYALLAALIIIINYRKKLASPFSQLISSTCQSASKVSGLVSKLPKKLITPPLLIATILIWIAILNMPDGKLHVSILDVGQGDAILIQTPNRQDILIDGGPSPQAISLELGEKLPFWDKTIDLVILTQPHADHVTGLVEVLKRYEVNQVIESEISYNSSIYQQWSKSVENEGTIYEIAHTGQEIDLGDGIRIEVLHPPSPLLQENSDDIDNNGVVLRLSWDKISFLFTADIRQEAEWYLVAQRADLNCTILKVPHHGSLTSTSPEFLAVAAPEIAVISAGTDNRFGHPHPEVVDRLTKQLGDDMVYLTSEHGTIEFITDGERLWVKTEQ